MSRQKAAICSSQAAAAFQNIETVATNDELSDEQVDRVIACAEHAIHDLVSLTAELGSD